MKNSVWQQYLPMLLFGVMIYFPLFHHLEWEPVHNWDESLFAMRAGFMAQEGQYMRDYNWWVDEGPIYRSTKPPFTTWIQALFMKVFGINELALRLPVALCALGTVVLIFWFSKKALKDYRIGYFAGFILVTTVGFVKEHASRTGDQDVPLALYMLAGAFAFYFYLEATDRRERNKWLALLTFTLIISALTKYVFGLFFLPAFLVYALYKRQLWPILKTPAIWLSLLAFVVAVGGWLMVIEASLPGFVERAFFHEMLDRYTSVIEQHTASATYYLELISQERFLPWLLLLPAPVSMLFLPTFRPYRDPLLLLFLCVLSVLLIITFAESKLPHYDVVLYPPLALLTGTGLYHIVRSAVKLSRQRKYLPFLITLALPFSFYFLFKPYKNIIDRTYMPRLEQANMKYGYLFRQVERKHPDIKKFTVLHPGFDGQALFYTGLFNRTKGYDLQIHAYPQYLKPEEIAMGCDKNVIKALNNQYEYELLEQYEECMLVRILRQKGSE